MNDTIQALAEPVQGRVITAVYNVALGEEGLEAGGVFAEEPATWNERDGR